MVDTENMVGLGQKEPYNESQELLQVNKAASNHATQFYWGHWGTFLTVFEAMGIHY